MSFPFSSNVVLREKGREWKPVRTDVLAILLDGAYIKQLLYQVRMIKTAQALTE